MIHIVFTTLSKAEHHYFFKQQLGLFPKSVQQKLLRFRRWQDAQSFIYGRLLLIKALSNFYNIRIDLNEILIDENFRPYLDYKNLDFNISHSGDLVVCAITNSQRVGIDVEKILEIQIEDFAYQMTEFEFQKINSNKNQLVGFYEYWTQKEAVLKANGRGLSIPLKIFEITNNKVELYDDVWYLTKLYIDEHYVCHFASNILTLHTLSLIESSQLRLEPS